MPQPAVGLLIAVEDLSEADVAQMLRTWSVDNAFGGLFRAHQIDGLALSLLDLDTAVGPDACDTGSWLVPDATTAAARPPPLLWKKLCALLRRAARHGGVSAETISQQRDPPTDGMRDGEDGTDGRTDTSRRSLSSVLPDADK